MAIVNDNVKDRFYHYLNRWGKHLENVGYDNEDIVNDFMWTEGFAGEELFNELLDILESDKQN